MASKAQQKAWLALFDDGNVYCPRGQALKAWLFGGQSIATRYALIDLTSYKDRQPPPRAAFGDKRATMAVEHVDRPQGARHVEQ